MRRRVVLALAVMVLALLLASGVALAVNKVGTDGPDTLRGTNRADNLSGEGGNDILVGLAGKDNLLGGQGKDVVIVGKDLEHFPGGDKNLVGGPGNEITSSPAKAQTMWWATKATTCWSKITCANSPKIDSPAGRATT